MPCFSHNEEVNAIIFYNVDISQRLQAISLPFADCAVNEATMNGCSFCFLALENAQFFYIGV